MIDDLIREREKKLARYETKKDAFPASVRRTASISDLLSNFDTIASSEEKIFLVGRVYAWRDQGKIIFADVRDERGKIQAVLSEKETKEIEFIKETIDIGDFIEVKGVFFSTQRGEKSIRVEEMRIIAKTMRPIPSSWYGVTDEDIRFRKRYLDFLLNEESRDIFRKKRIFWDAVRSFLNEYGFFEVEMPVLEPVPGGAEAEPFVTHHNALDEDFYLRISLELPLKKMLVGGFDSVFEIGRIFRNEGIDREHLQDYTQMECYRAYWDYRDMMKFVEAMYKSVIKKTFGTLALQWNDSVINWDNTWPTIEYYDVFQKESGIDLKTASFETLCEKAVSLGISLEGIAGKGRVIDLIYKKTVRPKLINPCFLVNPPVEIEPLAKRMENDKGRVERFQIVAYGTELGKGFSELNDPRDQRERFEEQMRLREAGDSEAQYIDESFLEALEYGMPPAGGFGMSERLFSVVLGKPIRETVIFPLMRGEK